MIARLFAPLAMKVSAGIIASLLIGLAVTWFGWSRAADARDEAQADLREAKDQLTLLKADAGLKDTLSKERVQDRQQTEKSEKELIDAIRSVPDEKPDAVRVRLGCERLRRTGKDTADLPPVCRVNAGTQTHPQP